MIKHIWKFCWKKKLKTQSQYFVNIYEAIHKFISFESHLNLRVHSTWNLLIIIKQVHSTGNWIVTGLGFFIFHFLSKPPSPAPSPQPPQGWLEFKSSKFCRCALKNKIRRVRSLSAPWKKLCNGWKFFSASLKKNSTKLSYWNPVILSGGGSADKKYHEKWHVPWETWPYSCPNKTRPPTHLV